MYRVELKIIIITYRVSTEDDNESSSKEQFGDNIDALAPILNDVSKIFKDIMDSTTSWYLCIYLYIYLYICKYVHGYIFAYLYV
jgi:hypothetical protein